MFKKIWNDPVGSKIIAGGILAILALVGTYIFNLWSIIGEFALRSWRFLKSPSDVPNWGIVVMGLLVLPTICIVIILVWAWLFQSNSKISVDWRSYREDKFFGITWRWMYFEDSQIYGLVSFCPYCDFQIYATSGSPFLAIQNVSFYCDSCNRNLGQLEESIGSLEDKVKRYIQQKVRNGTWVRSGIEGVRS